eukprot:scaffold284557_cov39-Prasinocladus_malaysianus.AAC.1
MLCLQSGCHHRCPPSGLASDKLFRALHMYIRQQQVFCLSTLRQQCCQSFLKSILASDFSLNTRQ